MENDEQLKFELKNLSVQPYTTTTTKTTVVNGDAKTKKTEKVSPFKKVTEIVSSGLSSSTNQTNTTNNNTTNNTETNKNNTNTTSNNSETDENKTIIYDPEWVEATFKVENVGITLD